MHTINRNRRRGAIGKLIISFFCYYLIVYAIYLIMLGPLIYILFASSRPKGIASNFYGLVTLMEFASLLHSRTRSTIKYLPVVTNSLLFAFLFYFQATIYGFYYLAMNAVIAWMIWFFVYLMLTYEIPSMDWNPFHHYCPSLDKPRTMYFAGFSLNWL